MSVEQVDVVEDLPTAARANAAVRALVADPGASAARSSDHLHASVNGLIDERVLSEARDDRPSPTADTACKEAEPCEP